MTSASQWTDLVMMGYKSRAIRRMRLAVDETMVPEGFDVNTDDDVLLQLIVIFFFMHVFVLWRASVYVATRWPDGVAAIRSLFLSFVLVVVMWLVLI